MITTGSTGLRFGSDMTNMPDTKGVISDQEILQAYAALPASDAREAFARDYEKKWKAEIERRLNARNEQERKKADSSNQNKPAPLMNASDIGTLQLPTQMPVQHTQSPYVLPIDPAHQFNIKDSSVMTQAQITDILKIAISNNMEVLSVSPTSIKVSLNGQKFEIKGTE